MSGSLPTVPTEPSNLFSFFDSSLVMLNVIAIVS